MAFICRQITRTSQPQELVGLAQAHFKGSVLSYNFGATGAKNLAQKDNGRVLPSVDVAYKANTGGSGSCCTSTARSFFDADMGVPILTSNGIGTGDFSIVGVLAPNASTVRTTALHIRRNAAQDYTSVFVQLNGYYGDGATTGTNLTGALYVGTFRDAVNGGGYGARGSVAADVVNGSLIKFAYIRYASGLNELWVNGRLAASSTTSVNSMLASGTQMVSVAGFGTTAGYSVQDPINLLHIANVAVDGESLSANPWQLFEPIAETIWIPDSVAGGVVSLSATASAQAASTADISKGVSLAAATLSIATGTAGMSLAVPLVATATGQASANGQIALSVTFAADALSSALATADITVGKALDAAATGQATGGATLSLAINLSAAAVSQATSEASFNGAVSLAASAIANAQASAALAVGKPLDAVAQAQASAGAALCLDVSLSAAALTQAVAAGALNLTVNLSAASVSNASAGAILPSEILLSADGVAVSTASAALTAGGTHRTYPLASATQAYQLAAIMQAYPLAGQTQHFPLEGLA